MQISEAESRVMQVLWERGPSTADEVMQSLSGVSDWQDATVKTLLNRLLKKGALAADAEGRRYRYQPLLAREAYVLEESRSLVERLFDGRIAPLVAHFSRHGQLDADDIAELRRLIEDIDDER
ncbi:MAG: BlaI/MecI/CopY family transcriptional regulator [Lysobacteraceae bacterium]|uniref:BlaI/MecI/CopY family transcriptional regulator n=1 Tax=Denitratimonas sp. CY0512 TaxID=3131940 RepID=UPI00309A94B3